MPNYGDVALNLSPKWSRSLEHNQDYALWTVGHENGVADVYLTSDPEAKHQFAWVDPRRKDEITKNKVKGYRFVHKSLFTKNENLWGDWTPDGFIQCFDQNLMCRPEELYLRDRLEREEAALRAKDKDSDAARRLAARAGIALTEDEDEQPSRIRRRRSA